MRQQEHRDEFGAERVEEEQGPADSKIKLLKPHKSRAVLQPIELAVVARCKEESPAQEA